MPMAVVHLAVSPNTQLNLVWIFWSSENDSYNFDDDLFVKVSMIGRPKMQDTSHVYMDPNIPIIIGLNGKNGKKIRITTYSSPRKKC